MTNLWMKLQLQDNKPNAVSDREADQETTADEINKLTEGGIKSRDILREKEDGGTSLAHLDMHLFKKKHTYRQAVTVRRDNALRLALSVAVNALLWN